MARATPDRYTTVAMLLHWLIAAAIVFQILLGWRMGWAPKGGALNFTLFQLHKSVGLTILLLSLARLAWRLFNPPPHIAQPAWEALAAKAVHIGFYLIMIGLPLTGWAMVSASKTHIPTLLYGVIPWPSIPGLPDLAAGPKHAWHEASEFSHNALVKLTYGLLILHLGAVAKHQLIDRDRVFAHMAAGARPGWAEPRLWLAGLLFAGVVAAGLSFTPALPRAAAPPPSATPVVVPQPVAAVPSAPAAAPVASPSAAPPAPMPPAPWTVRKDSSLGFATVWSGQAVEGHFASWKADILFSPTALDQSHIKVTIDLASVATGDAQRDATLPTEAWFDTEAHPQAVFTASTFRKQGEDRYVADGVLELRGVKKPVSLPFSLHIDGKTAHARGVVTLDRTAFGVGQGDFAATDQIPAGVKVSVQVVADRP